ncbi:MAG: MFS transporter [Henriciella sp.]|nr:MFS transporter [Henriciella sp.]
MTVNTNRLFWMSCIALTVTSMTFAIRASLLQPLGVEFGLSDSQLGVMTMMAFLGFPVATVFGGLIYNQVGPRNLMIVAFIGHVLGLVLTIYANGFWLLVISTFFVGFANGAVEAACNPMIADIYHKNKTTMLNRFHVWFPGGLVIGSLIGYFLGQAGIGWQIQVATMLVPTAIYGYMVFTESFPETENTESSTAENIKALMTPLFFVMCALMTITATTELATTQWITRLLPDGNPILVLALIFFIMALGRYFAGPIVQRVNPVGMLLVSAIVSSIGLFLISQAGGAMVYVAAAVFALGVTYFWPTMLGVVAEYMPRTGALGLSLVGGAGMVGLSAWQPVIGGWLDTAREQAISAGATGPEADIAAGQAALTYLNVFPVVLIVAFGILYFLRLKRPEETTAPSAAE